jgi:YVTN family beta-propeller protein
VSILYRFDTVQQYHSNITLKRTVIVSLFVLLLHDITIAQTTYKPLKIIYGNISPKSICNNGKNMFFVQNMMYHHSITMYDSSFNLVSTISDKVTPSQFGFKKIKSSLNGSPVESAATKDGKYVWVSNYFMSGEGFGNPGCDTCFGKNYDSSFVYKINTYTHTIENIVKVGSVPKYLAITPDQEKLLVSNWSSGDVSIIDLNTEKEIKRISTGPAPRGIACDSASTFAYIAVMGSSKIIKVNLLTYETETLVSGVMNPRHLCIDRNYLYASLNGEQAICRINLADKRMNKLNVGKAPRSMVLSPIYHKLFVDCYNDGKIAVIDLADFKLETTIKTNSYPIGICLNNNNKQIWVTCYTGNIEVFATEDSKEKKIESSAIATVKIKKKADSVVVQPKKNIAPVTTIASIEKPVEPKEQAKGYIVLGSFKVKENAVGLKKTLLQKGITIELVNTNKGFTYCAYRVKENKEESEKEITRLQVLTGIKGWYSSLQL